MKFLSILFLTLFITSCDDPLSERESEKTYLREYSNKSAESIKTNALIFLKTNTEAGSNITEVTNGSLVIAGTAQKTDFDDHGAILNFSVTLTAKQNGYELTLRQLNKIVYYNDDISGRQIRQESLDEGDKEDMVHYFNKLDSDLYSYILLKSTAPASSI